MLLAQHIFAQFTLPTKQRYTAIPLQLCTYLFLNSSKFDTKLFINHAIQM